MSIRWSALEISEAMDEIEALLDQSEPFLAQTEQKAIEATGIRNLSEHMVQRISRLVYTPKSAVETERERRNQLALPH